jgi:multisubunit Na+/H+ antiporter MnhB subunit
MDDYYIENAQQERNVNNIVTSVVFDYRAFDTLGEAAVLFTAVCSVLVVFRKGGHD